MSTDKKFDVPENKYEAVLVAAREARRLNELARFNDRELRRRPAALAWERMSEARVAYTYEPDTSDDDKLEITPATDEIETPDFNAEAKAEAEAPAE